MKKLAVTGLFALIFLSGCGSFKSHMYLDRPIGGETWKLGELAVISWTYDDWWGSCCHAADIYVRDSVSGQLTLIVKKSQSQIQENRATSSWRVGTLPSSGEKIILPAGAYTFRACDNWGGEIGLCDESGIVKIVE